MFIALLLAVLSAGPIDAPQTLQATRAVTRSMTLTRQDLADGGFDWNVTAVVFAPQQTSLIDGGTDTSWVVIGSASATLGTVQRNNVESLAQGAILTMARRQKGLE